jgi:DNA repair exonuclease SbcCD ATPase subunit
MISTVDEQDVEMDDTFAVDHDVQPVLSLGPGSGSLVQQESQSQSETLAALEEKIQILAQEKATLVQDKATFRWREECALRKLSRNGQGTLSSLETVTDRAVRQREELRAENQELRAAAERLESGVIDLQAKIASLQDKLNKTKAERIEVAQSKRRWVTRMWTLAGRLPGELRKKDAEIENMREKLVDMYGRLAQEQARLRKAQDDLAGERTIRIGAEAELKDAKAAHAQEIQGRDSAGQRLKDQLKLVVGGLESGVISI